MFVELLQAFLAIAAEVHVVALPLQCILHHEAQVLVVLYQQDTGFDLAHGGDAALVQAMAGKCREKVLPWPGSLCTVTRPPCASAICRT